ARGKILEERVIHALTTGGELTREELLAQRMIRPLHLDYQAALEPGTQPVLQSLDAARRPVRGEHDLTPRRVETVEQVEQLVLRALGAGELLYVIHEEHVQHPVAHAPALDRAVLERANELVGEVARIHAGDEGRTAPRRDEFVPHGVQQMRLAHAGWPVEVERIVFATRFLHDGVRGVHRELIGWAHIELGPGELHAWPGRWIHRADQSRDHQLRLRYALRVEEQLGGGQPVIEFRRGLLQIAQARDGRFVVREQRVHIRLARAVERTLQPARVIAQLVPVRDRLAHTNAPRFELLRQHLAHIREERVELAGLRPDRRGAHDAIAALAEQLAHRCRREG